ncbi:uncharacterized protein LOC117170162 [Belonocnema kinseyi]|uniref:uncharacterized protein LOC117170162 n=1 Tax=Belonocnema kinseyi TaxID=2817044 RepID=UPI00143D6596|nr:uncharacterized protein LOC117170162 [Belonocnema kinseyi]
MGGVHSAKRAAAQLVPAKRDNKQIIQKSSKKESAALESPRDQKKKLAERDSSSEESESSLINSFELLHINNEIVTISMKYPLGSELQEKKTTPKEEMKKSSDQLCSKEMRDYNAYRLIQAAYLDTLQLESRPMLTLEHQIHDIIACGKRIENYCYQNSNTKLEYYQQVYNQLERMKKELEEKSKRKIHLESQAELMNHLYKIQEQILHLCIRDDPTPITKEWQKTLSQDQRNVIIFKMLDALYPILDSKDEDFFNKLYNQISNVYGLESMIFMNATSLLEYQDVAYVMIHVKIPQHQEARGQMMRKQQLEAEKEHYEEKCRLLQIEKQRVERELKELKQKSVV